MHKQSRNFYATKFPAPMSTNDILKKKKLAEFQSQKLSVKELSTFFLSKIQPWHKLTTKKCWKKICRFFHKVTDTKLSRIDIEIKIVISLRLKHWVCYQLDPTIFLWNIFLGKGTRVCFSHCINFLDQICVRKSKGIHFPVKRLYLGDIFSINLLFLQYLAGCTSYPHKQCNLNSSSSRWFHMMFTVCRWLRVCFWIKRN